MSDAVAASVIRFVLQDIKTRSAGKATDAHGQMLASLSTSELQLFQSASALVHRRAVKKITAMPSHRSFFRVESLNRYHKHNNNGHGNDNDKDDDDDHHHHHHHHSELTASMNTSFSQPFDGSMVHGSGPNYYNVFAHYCSCQGFHETTIQCPTAMCKHMIAVLLADATAQFTEIAIQDLDFAKMLCPQLPTHDDDQ